MICCVVELFGPARLLAGVRDVELRIAEGATVRDVLRALGKEVPALVGAVLVADSTRLISSYCLSLNGRMFVDDPDLRPRDGDHFLVMLPAAGG